MSSILNPDFIIGAAGYLAYLIMADTYCKKYFGSCVRKEIFFVVLSCAAALTLNAAVQYAPDLYLLFSAIWQAAFITFILVFFGGSSGKKFFTACVLIAIFVLISNFTISVLSAFTLFLEHFHSEGTRTVLSGFENSAIEAASYCASVAALWLLCRNFDGFLRGDRGIWYAAASVPLVFIIAAVDFANWGASRGIMVRSGGEAGAYLDQVFSYLGFAALTAICALAAAAYIYFANKAYAEQQRNLRYKSQIAVYKTLTEQYSRTERLRHDMKNHIIALNALYKSKEWEKIGSYLKNMEERGTEKGADLTGNLAVDALLSQKKKTAEENGIEWECSVKIPKNITADEFDLCVIFGNILDNALEACEKTALNEKRFIHIRSCAVKNSFLTEIKNSAPEKDKATLKFSREKSLATRGIGLRNIKEAVGRLKGALHTEYSDGVFTTSVLLPMTAPAHDNKTDV